MEQSTFRTCGPRAHGSLQIFSVFTFMTLHLRSFLWPTVVNVQGVAAVFSTISLRLYPSAREFYPTSGTFLTTTSVSVAPRYELSICVKCMHAASQGKTRPFQDQLYISQGPSNAFTSINVKVSMKTQNWLTFHNPFSVVLKSKVLVSGSFCIRASICYLLASDFQYAKRHTRLT